jgi:hypothetical protein
VAPGSRSPLCHHAQRHAGVRDARGEHFTIRPGDILLAQDNTGSGHRWKLIGDEPWRRAYVVFPTGAALPYSQFAET